LYYLLVETFKSNGKDKCRWYEWDDIEETGVKTMKSIEEEKKEENSKSDNNDDDDSKTFLYVDYRGKDDDDDENSSSSNDGITRESAFRSIHAAQERIFTIRREEQNSSSSHKFEIRIAAGICYLSKALHLSSRDYDSNIDWTGDEGKTILSGGIEVSTPWIKYNDRIWVTDLSNNNNSINISAVDGLFAWNTNNSIEEQHRLVRARYPNGNSELDQMPMGYAKFGGSVSSVKAWIKAKIQSQQYPSVQKPNTTIYPWFGHSRDNRWVMDYHTEQDNASYYDGQHQFWRPSIGTILFVVVSLIVTNVSEH